MMQKAVHLQNLVGSLVDAERAVEWTSTVVEGARVDFFTQESVAAEVFGTQTREAAVVQCGARC